MPGLLLALTALAELGAVVLSWGLEPAYDTVLYAVFSTAMTGAGALILSQLPRHPIGWLLCAIGLENALAADLAQGWGLRAAERGWPGGPFAQWLDTASWLPQVPALVLILLLFPTGHLSGRRWSMVGWLSVLGALLAELGWALDPGTGSEFIDGRNPFAVEGLPANALFTVGFVLVGAALLLALVAVVVRLRRATGVARQQLKWFAFASGALAIGLPVAGALWRVTPVAHVLPALVLTAWPIAIGLAILRYHLYDVDLVISRTFTYAVLTGVLAAVYAAVVIVLGAAIGRDSAVVTAAATLGAAASVKLMHRRVQERVDRRFRPQHRDALDTISAFVDDLRHDRVEPEQVVAALRRALGDPRLELWFLLRSGETPLDEHGRPVTAVADGRDVDPVRRGGAVIASIVWSPGDDADRALLPGAVAAAALPIEMARLRVELRRRLEEVDASRTRIAAVADEERRRIERDLHDGAQQRLVSIGLALRHAQHQMRTDAEGARRTLDGAVVEIAAAIEELRALAHGLKPALLQAGLAPALRDLASRATVPVEVCAGSDRYPPDVEAAAYFVACEGLTNAVKHARADHVVLHVARHDSTLRVSVVDDGVGGATIGRGSGLSGLCDRVESRGGRLRIESLGGRGTTLSAELPCVS